MDIFENGPAEAFCGYFDVSFKGSQENPADHDILLSTAPDPTGATHWGQQNFFLHPPISCAQGNLHLPHRIQELLECEILLDAKTGLSKSLDCRCNPFSLGKLRGSMSIGNSQAS